MRIALGQLNFTTGDIEGNTRKIIAAVEQARSAGADIAVFPEMAITGYCVSDLVEDRSFVAANMEALWKIAPRTRDIIAVVGFVEYDPLRLNEDGTVRKYNSAAVIQNGRIVGVARKSLLPNYRYFDDKRYFSPAECRKPIEVNVRRKLVRLGIAICEDMWDENYELKPIRELAQKGADIIININASPFIPGKWKIREDIIQRHIANTGLAFVYVNTVGASDNGKNIIPFDGNSTVHDSEGRLVGLASQFAEDLPVIELKELNEGHSSADHKRFSGKSIERPLCTTEEELYSVLVMSVRDYAVKTGFKSAVVPLSGGIDSAIGLCITVDALGKENVKAFNLPSRFNTDTTKRIAETIAKNIGVEYCIIPIERIDSVIREEYEKVAGTIHSKTAKENLHARIRGVLMMLYSNDTGALLISNGNETEIGLGYNTLYGDMCGGISVIGDLTKMEVYKLGRYINSRYGFEVLPEEIFTIRPSAELSEGQYDPFDYPVVSPIVNLLAERKMSPEEILMKFKYREFDEKLFLPDSEGRTIYERFTYEEFKKLVKEIYDMMAKAVYKRMQGPPIIAVSERAFGFDLRETIINRWRGLLE
ncbi:MAG: NAD(+) synthase [Thermoplasmata archaeon]